MIRNIKKNIFMKMYSLELEKKNKNWKKNN